MRAAQNDAIVLNKGAHKDRNDREALRLKQERQQHNEMIDMQRQ